MVVLASRSPIAVATATRWSDNGAVGYAPPTALLPASEGRGPGDHQLGWPTSGYKPPENCRDLRIAVDLDDLHSHLPQLGSLESEELEVLLAGICVIGLGSLQDRGALA